MLSDFLTSESNYTCGRSLIGGNVAQVFEGTENATNDRVVLKYLKSETPQDQVHFQREVEIMSKMTHPATLSMRGYSLPFAGRASGLIVMDFMQNGSMDEVNQRVYMDTAPAGWDATARSKAVFGMAAGLCFLHSLNYVHRDLKPANVLLDGNWEVRLTDFGQSRAVGTDMTLAPGTPLTQAPETYNDDPYDNKVDVYSYAVCLYLMFCPGDALDDNPRPFQNSTAFMRRVNQGARLKKKDAIPEVYWTLIVSCWDQLPANRPSFVDIIVKFRQNRDWVLEGTNMEELAAYEKKVWNGLVIPEMETRPASENKPTGEDWSCNVNYTSHWQLCEIFWT
jgi:serine/threonine protein kinase